MLSEPESCCFLLYSHLTSAQLYLIDETAPDSEPGTLVARYHPMPCFSRKRKAYLEIFDAGEHIVDSIVLTFLYVEKIRRR
jgi:hypothetical protein